MYVILGTKVNQTEFIALATSAADTKLKLEKFQTKTANKTDLALKANVADLTSRASLTNLETKVSKTGDTINGDFLIELNNDTTRSFGVNELGEGKSAVLLLGNTSNSILSSHNNPLLITGEKGIKFNSSHGDVCLFGRGNDAKAEFFQLY